MIILVSPVVLFLTAIFIIFIKRFRPKFTGLWLVAVFGTVISWISLILFRFNLPFSFTLINWANGGVFGSSLQFIMDYASWPYAIAINALIFAFVLSSPARLRTRSEITSLAGNLTVVGLSYIAILAANPVTFLYGWAALDLVEFSILLWNNPDGISHRRIVIGFISRFIGIFLIFLAFLLGGKLNTPISTFSDLTPEMGIPLLFGIVLHLGIIQVHNPKSEQTNSNRNQGTILQLVSTASSTILLSRIPDQTLKFPVVTVIFILVFITVLFECVRWLQDKKDLDTRYYWVMLVSGFAILTAINGSPIATTSWGISLIILGGMFFIHQSSTSFIKILLILGTLFMSGISYLPNASGLAGLVNSDSLINELICLLLFIIFLFGMFLKISKIPPLDPNQERIVYLMYPMSIIMLLITYLFIGFYGWPGSYTLGSWMAVLLGSIFSALSYFIWRYRYRIREKIATGIARLMLQRIQRLMDWIKLILNPSYLSKGVTRVVAILRLIIGWSSDLLEGQSGLLWGIVMLVLLSMIIGKGF